MSAPAAIIYPVASLKKGDHFLRDLPDRADVLRKCLDSESYFSWFKHHICLLILTIAAFFRYRAVQDNRPIPLSGWFELRLTLKDLGYFGMLIFVLMLAVMPLVSPISLLFITGSAGFGPYLGYSFLIGAILNANITFFLVRTLSIEEMWEGGENGPDQGSHQEKRLSDRAAASDYARVPFVAINSAAAASGSLEGLYVSDGHRRAAVGDPLFLNRRGPCFAVSVSGDIFRLHCSRAAYHHHNCPAEARYSSRKKKHLLNAR